MKELYQVFSNREIALLLWSLLTILFLFSKKKVLQSFSYVIKAFFAKKIISLVILLLLYSVLPIILLVKLNLWENYLIKDFTFWFLTVAMVLFFNMNMVKENIFFKNVVFDSLKLTVLLEFIVNFYNFSLLVETIIVPIILLLSITQVYAETTADKNPEFLKTGKFLNNILSFIGLFFICYSIFMTIVNYSELFTLDNYKAVVLPPIFTLWILPILYVIALIINYESLFLRIQYLTEDVSAQKEIKKQILLTANFNLSKLARINRNINLQALTIDIKGFIKSISN